MANRAHSFTNFQFKILLIEKSEKSVEKKEGILKTIFFLLLVSSAFIPTSGEVRRIRFRGI